MPSPAARALTPALIVSLLAVAWAGCANTARSAGIRLLYRQQPAPARVLLDVPYRPGSADPKHRLDLYLPGGAGGWPVLVFVHGGGWDGGDKGLRIAGADVYGNIGRFYSRRGIGAAVVNYRLQPEATWRQQVADVAAAVGWVHRHVARYGGDPRALFLAGHSAGAQLAAFVALDAATLERAGLTPADLCGIIPISGAAFDMTDERTYELGADREYLEERFRLGASDRDWMRDASAISHLSPRAPRFLLLHGALEWKALAYQNQLLDRALRDAGVASELRVFPQLHQTMVLALARESAGPARQVLRFVRESTCTD